MTIIHIRTCTCMMPGNVIMMLVLLFTDHYLPCPSSTDSPVSPLYIHMHCMYVYVYHVCVFLDIPRQLTCMKLGTRELYQPIQSCHVVCLGISNKSVTVPRQDSIHPCRARAVLSGHCNIIYIYTVYTYYIYISMYICLPLPSF